MNLIGVRDPNLMATIMFNTGDTIPSREGRWRPLVVIFSTFVTKDINNGWRHGSVLVVEVTKYLCMSR